MSGARFTSSMLHIALSLSVSHCPDRQPMTLQTVNEPQAHAVQTVAGLLQVLRKSCSMTFGCVFACKVGTAGLLHCRTASCMQLRRFMPLPQFWGVLKNLVLSFEQLPLELHGRQDKYSILMGSVACYLHVYHVHRVGKFLWWLAAEAERPGPIKGRCSERKSMAMNEWMPHQQSLIRKRCIQYNTYCITTVCSILQMGFHRLYACAG